MRFWTELVLVAAALWAAPASGAEPNAPAASGQAAPAGAGGKKDQPAAAKPLEAWEVQVIVRMELLQNMEMLEQMELLEDLPVLKGSGGEK